MEWVRIWNRLFDLINRPGEMYYSGSRFIAKVREVDPYFLTYKQYIEARQQAGEPTSRKDFFFDILRNFDDARRARVMSAIIDDLAEHEPEAAAEIRGVMGGMAGAPIAIVPVDTWGAERLNSFLEEMDTAITGGQYERAVSLGYTCLEGFYRAFAERHAGSTAAPTEIIALSRWIRDCLRTTVRDYPDEVLNLINHTSHAVDRARNRFSEAHFGGDAGRWLAAYVRDIVNVQIRLLLHFM